MPVPVYITSARAAATTGSPILPAMSTPLLRRLGKPGEHPAPHRPDEIDRVRSRSRALPACGTRLDRDRNRRRLHRRDRRHRPSIASRGSAPEYGMRNALGEVFIAASLLADGAASSAGPSSGARIRARPCRAPCRSARPESSAPGTIRSACPTRILVGSSSLFQRASSRIDRPRLRARCCRVVSPRLTTYVSGAARLASREAPVRRLARRTLSDAGRPPARARFWVMQPDAASDQRSSRDCDSHHAFPASSGTKRTGS